MDWLRYYGLGWLPLAAAFVLASWLVYRAEVAAVRWLRRRPLVVQPAWNPEVERENRWLSQSNHQLARDLEALKRQVPLAKREGRLEALEWCYFAAKDAGCDDLAKRIDQKRKGT